LNHKRGKRKQKFIS